MWLLEHADVTADYVNGRNEVMVKLLFQNKEIWEKRIAITADQVERTMDDEDLEKTISRTLRAHLNIVAQMHFARLELLFPKSIAEVTMGYDSRLAVKTIHVKFKNGHVAEGPESEAKTELFHARCAMLYDLPPI